ncbi:MAG: M1 family metallopeptidase, partial [Planctomycetota bacterium]
APSQSGTASKKQATQDDGFSRQDKLRGAITPERSWWDVLHYDLALRVLPETKRLEGCNKISFSVTAPQDRMQIDLQPPLAIQRVVYMGKELKFEREGKVYWVQFAQQLQKGTEGTVEVHYGGKPVQSQRPPWSGGLSWRKDSQGNHFIATTCQGIGASIWWPNKDHGYDEPQRGMDIRVTVPESLVGVSNGRLVETTSDAEQKTKTFHWQVTNPINNYGVNVNVGNYVSLDSSFEGEGGTLDVQYWMLEHQVEKAKKQFLEVPRTLAAFEHWFGKYPFYEDSYKIVCVPYLGMEHQSSVTYGNGFQNGYRGRDLSKTGVGMKFDFIVVHESAHEWWGNNISMKDAADMWIHESFANYAENLFVEYHFTEKEAQDYVIGCRALIRNDRPIIGIYNRNSSGSGDMYYKGGNMLHTMRHILGDDAKWRRVLRGLNEEFWHQTIGTKEFEAYISRECGFDFDRVFEQYLRTTKIPELNYRIDGSQLKLSWANTVEGFALPVIVHVNGTPKRVVVGTDGAKVECDEAVESVDLDRNFYMKLVQR